MNVSGIVLAGGLGRRMGGVDKGLQLLRGKPMVEWVLARLSPQVDDIVINANQNLERYQAYGHRVVSDQIAGFAGPLAGLHAGLKAVKHPLIVTVPCDSPLLPIDLVERLRAALGAHDLAVAKTGEQAHPVFALVKRECRESLEAFLAQGGRKIDAWYAALKVVEVSFDDEAQAFRNINTLEELGEIGTDPIFRKIGSVPISQIVSCLDGYDPDALHVAKAREAMHACITPLAEVETLPVRSALGRVLAQDIVPSITVPAHDNSAMDGYAVRFADLGNPLREIGTALAGKPFGATVGAGECVRVMTGAVMPKGTDTVIIQEVVKKEAGRIIVPPGQKRAQNVRYAGEDLKIGVPVLAPGKFLQPAELGLIASLGIGEVRVKRKLRVAFFATGDELASIGATLKEGEVYDSNRYTLHGMLERMGVEINDLGVVRDEPAQLERALRQAAEGADAVITTGGVSVGEADFVRTLMAKLGEVLFWKIAMRPGRPMAFGKVGDAFLFGLPGNPVAVMVTFYQFVRDALWHLAGRNDDYAIPLLTAIAAENLRKVPGRTEYQRGVLFKQRNEWRVRTTGQQGSGVLRSMSEANCFIVLEHERGSVAAGEQLGVQLFEGLT